MQDPHQQPVWQYLLTTLIGLLGMGAMIWMELPPSQRMMLTLAVREKSYRVLHAAARAAGRWGMSSELADHAESMAFGYGIAYRLAQWRDRV
jgi:hypothetical protein